MTLSDERRQALAEAGQGHALERWDALAATDGAAAERLASELAAVDLSLLGELFEETKRPPKAATRFEPPALFPLRGDASHAERVDEARARGAELLAAGKVGFVLVAGGQASRLGYDAPKGDFPIGPVTDRTLFAYHAQRLLAAQARHGTRAPWYVMTSAANDAATKEIFERDDYFGLAPDDVFFFSQDMLPALDQDGRLVFADRDRLFLAPNGHGGCLLGLASSGALDDMRARGLEQLSYFQVDNPLVRPADPVFLGLHAEADAQMSTKVVEKRDASEKVGVIGRIDGVLGCIEYSDLPDEAREARDPEGALRFRAGNIAVHALSVDFLAQVTQGALSLPWHVARKNLAAVDERGNPAEVPGFKFETFVFDALALAERSVTMEVDRGLEFAPVKNKEGEDSPATSRAALSALASSWVQAAGGELPAPGPDGLVPIEVDPRYAESAEEFAARGGAPRAHGSGHVYGV